MNHSSDTAWFAVQTRPRHERAVSSQIESLGFEAFAPVVPSVRIWSDRRKTVELPLFPHYAFVKLRPTPEEKVRILRLHGVHGFVGCNRQGTPIPDKQIADIHTLVGSGKDFSLISEFRIGQRVRVCSGCLAGIEGVLSAKHPDRSLLISLESIQQSISIRIDGYQIEAV